MDEFTNAVMRGSTFSSCLRHKTAYNEMLFTGTLNLIKNFELRSEVNNFVDRLIDGLERVR